MKTLVYVDGFNLYYGALKNTPYKWLDLHALCRVMLPRNTIAGIKYFTARLRPRADDPDRPTRQFTYLRALRTLPNLQIVWGHYLTHVVWMPLAFPAAGQKRFVQVIKTEEKGSDVNLASHLLLDTFNNAFECAVILSGDSDLQTPIRMVTDQFHKPVGVLNPQQAVGKALQSVAAFYKHIRESALRSSQFPAVVTDNAGTFRRPASW